MSADAPRYWVAIPAAGIGSRMRGVVPKQYLDLLGRRVIEHTLSVFLDHPRIHGIVLALHPQDTEWPDCEYAGDARVATVSGGSERADSVLAMLDWLLARADPDDWVLVHDAARPCLSREDLDRLLARASAHPVGGLLGVPVADTMKRADVAGEVLETVSRERLWHALTPQMFRVGGLHRALSDALARGLAVTDDASAMELAGLRPLLVEGSRSNLKITRPDDLPLASFYLSANPTGER